MSKTVAEMNTEKWMGCKRANRVNDVHFNECVECKHSEIYAIFNFIEHNPWLVEEEKTALKSSIKSRTNAEHFNWLPKKGEMLWNDCRVEEKWAKN